MRLCKKNACNLENKANLGSNVQGEIIAVDDQWNGLSITKSISVQVK